MTDLCVFTCGYTDPPIDTSLLRASCKRVGIELQAYGSGERWPGFCVGKIRAARQFLAARREEYALFVDSSDTFIVSAETAILESFQSLGTSVLVSGEKNCYPIPADATRYPQSGAPDDPGTPWRFVNSGGWIGQRTRLVEVLGELDNIFVSLAKQGGDAPMMISPVGQNGFCVIVGKVSTPMSTHNVGSFRRCGGLLKFVRMAPIP